jgi:hypothetical protein
MLFPALDNLCYIKPPFLRFLLEHVARMSLELNYSSRTFLPWTTQAQVCKLTDFFMTGSSDPYWYCVSFCICHPWLGKICTPKERGTWSWCLPKDRLVWCIMSALLACMMSDDLTVCKLLTFCHFSYGVQVIRRSWLHERFFWVMHY